MIIELAKFAYFNAVGNEIKLFHSWINHLAGIQQHVSLFNSIMKHLSLSVKDEKDFGLANEFRKKQNFVRSCKIKIFQPQNKMLKAFSNSTKTNVATKNSNFQNNSRAYIS